MRTSTYYLLLSLLFIWCHHPGYSQCSPPRSDDCDGAGANVLCGLSAMNGYTCQNADYVNTQGPPSLCPGWGAPTNIGWWAFVTNGGNVCITIDYTNCKFPPPGGTNGIQLGIYEDCSFQNLIVCDATCPGPSGTKTICGNLEPCKVYYFFVDGCNGDVCDFTLHTVGGAAPTLDPIGKINNDADRKIEVCKGACDVKFQVKAQSGNCAATYVWTLDGVEQNSNTHELTLDFPNEGSFQLCATAIIGTQSSICDKNGPECATIIVKQIPDRKGGPYKICTEKLPYMWHDQMVTGPGTYKSQFMDANCCIYDSVADFIIIPVPTPPNVYFIGCNPQDVYTDAITGAVFNSCESGTTINLPASSKPYGCDSSYNLTAIFLDYNVAFEEYCVDQVIEINPQIINLTKSCNGGESVSYKYNWYAKSDPGKKTLSTNDKLQISKKDDYCLELTVDASLGNVTKSCKYNFCEAIDEDKFNLVKTCPHGDTNVCANAVLPYFIDTFFNKKDIIQHRWVVTNGTILTKNPFDTNIIDIKWNNIPGEGKICYSLETNCGISPECCQKIYINPAPNPSAGNDQLYCGTMNGSFAGKADQGGHWEIIQAPGNVIINDPLNDKSMLSVDQFGQYIFVWQEQKFGCIGNDTVVIQFISNPEKDQEVYICGSTNQDYKMKFQISKGTAPYKIIKGNGSIDINNVYTSSVIKNLTKDTVIIEDANGCSFQFIHEYECKCTNQIGSLDATPVNICSNGKISLNYDNTGEILNTNPPDTLMFIIYTNQNDPLGSIIKTLNTNELTYDPVYVFGQTYFAAGVLGRKNNSGGIDYGKGCVRITNGKAFIFYAYPSPSAGSDASICGDLYTLNGSASLANTNLKWRLISGSGVIFTDDSKANTQVQIQGAFGKYVFELEENNQNICVNTDRVEINFLPSPEISNIDKICVFLGNPGSTDGKFIVKADIKGGTAPYTLISTGGKIVNNQWCSDTLFSLTNFSVQIKDANNCISELINDVHNCNCPFIDAGRLDSVVIGKCVDQCFSIKSILPEQINPNEDVAMYVLHTGFYKNAIDTFYSINDQICFNKNTMLTGKNNVYYISRIVGDDINPKDGTVDSKDPCIRVSNNQAIYWETYPVANAGSDLVLCGLNGNLNANLNLGSGQWRLLSGPGNIQFSSSTDAHTSIQVSSLGNYLIEWANTNDVCTTFDTVLVSFVDSPVFDINGINYICDNTAENFKIQIKVQQGDQSSWFIQAFYKGNISVNGNLNGNIWESDWIPNGEIFTLTVNDKNNCAKDTYSNTHQCPCITKLGTIANKTISLCEGQTAIADYLIAGEVRDANDQLFYLLLDGINPSTATLISSNNNGLFNYDAAKIQLNKKYFIAVVLGNKKTTSGLPDFNDRCLLYDIIEVTWYAKPNAIISGSKQINCKTKVLNLDGSKSGTASGQLPLYAWTTVDGHFVNPIQQKDPTIDIDAAGTYVLEITDPLTGCKSSSSWIITKDIQLPVLLIDNPEVITCERTQIQLTGNSTNATNVIIQWYGPQINSTANQYKISVGQSGRYTLVIENKDNGCIDSMSILVNEDKRNPIASINAIGQLTCENAEIELDGSGSLANSGTINKFSWSSFDGNIISGAGSSKIKIGKPGGHFVLEVKDNNNGCIDTASINIQELANPLKKINLDVVNPKCFGDKEGSINVLSVIDNNNSQLQNLKYKLNAGSYSTNSNFSNLAQGNYSVTAIDQNGCTLVQNVSITEPGKLQMQVIKQIVVNQGDLVKLDSLLLNITGGTMINGQYKDTVWTNLDDKLDWESQLRYLADHTRNFSIKSIDASGCEVTQEVKVIVKIVRDIWWPTSFSPNGDGINDKFTIFGKNVKGVKTLNIFDRWGEMVYTSNNINLGNSTQGWDGNYRSEKALPGVYTFVADVEYLDGGGTEKLAGEFTLIR